MNFEITVTNNSGQILSNSSGENEAVLVHEGGYNEGDVISVMFLLFFSSITLWRLAFVF